MSHKEAISSRSHSSRATQQWMLATTVLQLSLSLAETFSYCLLSPKSSGIYILELFCGNVKMHLYRNPKVEESLSFWLTTYLHNYRLLNYNTFMHSATHHTFCVSIYLHSYTGLYVRNKLWHCYLGIITFIHPSTQSPVFVSEMHFPLSFSIHVIVFYSLSA